VGVIEKHDNRSHDPPYAESAELSAHAAQLATDDSIGHVRGGGEGNVTINGDGSMTAPGGGADSFFELTDVNETEFAGSPSFLVYVNPGASALEFVDGLTLFAAAGHDHDGVYLTEAEADLLYADIGHNHTGVYSPVGHDHSGVYSPVGHNHDLVYAAIDHVQEVTKGGTGLTAIAADQIIYGNGVNAYTTTTLTSFARNLLDDANAAAGRATLELVAGATGDIWVEKGGDTMTGNLTLIGGAGVAIVGAAVDSIVSSVVLFHVRKDQDNVMDAVFENRSAGTAAQTRFQLRNGSSALDGLTVGVTGTGFTATGGFFTRAGYIESSGNMTGGLSLLARNASGSVRIYTGGFADANLRLVVTSTGLIGVGTSLAPETVIHVRSLNPEVRLTSTTGGIGNYAAISLLTDTGGTEPWTQIRGEFIAAGDADLIFSTSTDSGTTLVDHVRITHAGNTFFGLTFTPAGVQSRVHVVSSVAISTNTDYSSTYAAPALGLLIGSMSASQPWIRIASLSTESTSDPLINFLISGATNWIVGVDNSASDAFKIAANSAFNGTNEFLVLTTGGSMYLNATTNSKMTMGLTINQGANDDEIFALQSSDVAHGMTDLADTSTYLSILKGTAGSGTALIRGFTESIAGIYLVGYATTAVGTRLGGSFAAVVIDGRLKSGTSAGSLGADKNILAVADNGTCRFFLDSDGDSHQDVGTAWTNFDTFDDPALLTDLSIAVSSKGDPIRQRFQSFVRYNRAELERARLVTFSEDGHHFVNMSRLTMLHTGAIRQLHDRLRKAEEARTAELAELDRRLTAIERALGI
jgi:hypothetical protein